MLDHQKFFPVVSVKDTFGQFGRWPRVQLSGALRKA